MRKEELFMLTMPSEEVLKKMYKLNGVRDRYEFLLNITRKIPFIGEKLADKLFYKKWYESNRDYNNYMNRYIHVNFGY